MVESSIIKLSFLSVILIRTRSKAAAYLICLSCVLFTEAAFSQNTPDGTSGLSAETQTNLFEDTEYKERGIPYIQNYIREDYSAGPDNWAIVQSREGIVYFGNKEGVLEYDGISWRLLQLSNQSVARSLAVDQNNNKIFVGGKNDLGFLAPDSAGQMQFISLKNKLDPSFHDFQNIWFTHVNNNRVYFSSFNYLMKWDGNEFDVQKPDRRFRFSKIIDDTLYIMEENVGLRRLIDDSLQTILPQSELQDVQIYGLASYNEGQLLALSYQKGLFLIENSSMIPFTGPADEYLKNKFTYHMELLPNGWYSIATLRGGIVVMDRNGRIVQLLNKENGLVDNSVYFQFTDRQNGLWLATSQGISRVELLSPFTIIDDRLGVEGFISKVNRHDDTLYIAGNQGILRLEETNFQTSEHRFELIEPLSGEAFQGFDLLSVGQSLFAFANPGLYEILDGEIINELPYKGSRFFRSGIDSNRIYLGLIDGLASLLNVDGSWIDDGRINGVVDDIRDITEDEDGNLWLKSQTDGVWRVEFLNKNDSTDFHNPFVKHFRSNHELPAGTISLSSIRGKPVFGINGKVYRYHAEMDSIVFDPTFGDLFGLTGKFTPKVEDEHGNVWMFAQHGTSEQGEFRVAAIPKNDGNYSIKKLHDERISQLVGFIIYPEDNGIVWYGGSDGIVRHDTNLIQNTELDFQPLIRKVTANGDSLVFGGTAGLLPEISLPYTSNNIRFEFAAPSFDDESANQFQFRLENFEEGWSAWTSETQKDYTNIPEGSYTFRLRAKNVYGIESAEAAFPFKIFPPLYRTWWAYSLYILAFAGFIISIVRWRSYKLQQEKEVLHKIVAEQTRQVKQQAEQLKELDRAKSRFFANISHEFRTPLTLILGQVKQLELERIADDPQPIYQMIRRNGNRVLALVNQLLDLSTLESGKMTLQAEKTDLEEFFKPIVAAYGSLAESKNITFRFNTVEEHIFVYLDTDKMEKVVQNVVSNAFKFTEKGGEIILTLTSSNIEGKSYAQIRVEDSGMGIASDQLGKVFDRFYRDDKSNTGSGIGLALARELVTLHKGEISVESTLGKGSCFIISLPFGKQHLSDDEIINHSASSADKDSLEEILNHQVPQHETTGAAADVLFTEDSERQGGLPRILVVEDHADMRQYIHQILYKHYQVEEAEDGTEGWEEAIKMIPDLVISDVMMPGIDGVELCRKLKEDERTSHIPVVLLTAKAGKTSKIKGLENLADDYLTKPFDSDELLVLLRNRIEQRTRLREHFSRQVTVQPKDIAITTADEKFLQRAIDLVEENMDDFEFSVTSFVEQMYLGRTQVNRKIKALTDLTPVQFIRTLRLKRAAQKIAKQEDTISQIAYSVGFNNLSYFAKCFKDQFGESPSDYTGNQEHA